MQVGRFADAQESRYQATKRSNMALSPCRCVGFSDAQVSLFRLPNAQIWKCRPVGGRFVVAQE